MHINLPALVNKLVSQSGTAWGISTILHILAFILLGCYCWQELTIEAQSLIVTVNHPSNSEDFTPIITVQVPQDAGSGANAEEAINQSISEPTADVEVAEIIIEKPQLLSVGMSSLLQATDLTAELKANIKSLAGLRYLASLEQGGGAGVTGSGGGSFLKTSPLYQRVVYVIDASGSMNHAHASPALTRLGRVKVEILRSIESLQPEQEFFVIFFTQFAHPIPSKNGYIRKSSPILDEHLTWMAQHFANGETDPRLALQMALNMEPDVIFFMTDGEVHPLIVQDIIKYNQAKVKINTVCIGSAPSEHLMQQIAKKHQGTYTFVP